MKEELPINEFTEMVSQTGSLVEALGLMAQIYKRQIPKKATLKNSAISCYLSGALSALILIGALGCLTDKGEHLVTDFRDHLLSIFK